MNRNYLEHLALPITNIDQAANVLLIFIIYG